MARRLTALIAAAAATAAAVAAAHEHRTAAVPAQGTPSGSAPRPRGPGDVDELDYQGHVEATVTADGMTVALFGAGTRHRIGADGVKTTSMPPKMALKLGGVADEAVAVFVAWARQGTTVQLASTTSGAVDGAARRVQVTDGTVQVELSSR